MGDGESDTDGNGDSIDGIVRYSGCDQRRSVSRKGGRCRWQVVKQQAPDAM